MNIDELEEKLSRLMSFPLKAQIKIDFNKDKKSFSLSVPVFRSGKRKIPLSIQNYVIARHEMTFQPHTTSYHLVDNEVLLLQEIPFDWGFQPTLRNQVVQFWHLAKRCHQMLVEIGAEEKMPRFG